MSSPFKFLDAFTAEDKDLFFGRDNELEELYEKIFKSNLLLLYGASGTGKTSIVQCGLSKKFSDENWFAVYVRRQDNLNNSLLSSIKANSITKVSKSDLDPDLPEITQRIEGLYLDHFKPLYFIFDQLEELFILGDTKEQALFYSTIKALIESNIQCKIILIIREEYIAALSQMEEAIPHLFDNRVRIEKMHKKAVKGVIEESCTAIPDIKIEGEELFLEKVIENLSEDSLTVELTYLQVYLDKLYKSAKIDEGIHLFNLELLEATGKVHDVLAQFLEEHVHKLKDSEFGWKILKVFITKDGTKKGSSIAEVKKALDAQNYTTTLNEIKEVIQQFLTNKILRELDQSNNLLELTHDSLAMKTFEKLDAKERNLIEIQSLISQQYNGYVKSGSLLSRKNLHYITPYLKDLTLGKDYQKFIRKSEKELNRKRKLRIAGTIGIIVLLSLLSIVSGLKWDEADSQKTIAESKSIQLAIEKAKTDSALVKANREKLAKEKALEEATQSLEFARQKKQEADSQKTIAESKSIQLAIEKAKTELALTKANSLNLISKSEAAITRNPTSAFNLAVEAHNLSESPASIRSMINAFYHPLMTDRVKFPAKATYTVFNSKNKSFIVGLENGMIKLCDDEFNNCKTMLGHKGQIKTITVDSSRNRIFTSSSDRKIKIWDSNGNFIDNYNDIFSEVIKICILNEDDIVIAFANGNVKLFDKDFNKNDDLVSEIELLSIRDMVVTINKKIIVLDEANRVWLFNELGGLIKKFSNTTIKAITTQYDNLYFAQSNGKIEKVALSNLVAEMPNFLEGELIMSANFDVDYLDFIEKNKFIVYGNNSQVSIIKLDDSSPIQFHNSDFLNTVTPVKNMPKGYFVSSTSDSIISVYDLNHFEQLEFDFKPSLFEKGIPLINKEFKLMRVNDEILFNHKLDKQEHSFRYSKQPISKTDNIEVLSDTIDNLVFEGVVIRDNIRLVQGSEVRLKGINDNLIFIYDHLSNKEKVTNILISEDKRFALVFFEMNNGNEKIKIFPLPRYIYEFSKKIYKR